MATKLFRSRRDKILGGVCGGLGNYWRVDPTFIRLIYLFLTIVTGILPLALIYALLWVVMPLEPEGLPAESFNRLYRSRTDRRIAGVCGGLGEFFHVDSTVVRLIVVLVGLLTAIIPMLAAYGLAWFIIPEQTTTQVQEV